MSVTIEFGDFRIMTVILFLPQRKDAHRLSVMIIMKTTV